MMRALFIDLDGTLADTLPPLYEIYCEFLQRFGVEGNREEFQELNGRTIGEIVTFLRAKHDLTFSNSELEAEYEARVYSLYSSISLFPSVRETLDWAQKLPIPIFLVTAATARLATGFVKNHDLTDFFANIVTAEGIAGKPSPAIYKRALQLAGVSEKEAIAIEDSAHGLQAALSAGIYCLQLTGRSFSHRNHREVINWEEIQNLLDKQFYELSDL